MTKQKVWVFYSTGRDDGDGHQLYDSGIFAVTTDPKKRAEWQQAITVLVHLAERERIGRGQVGPPYQIEEIQIDIPKQIRNADQALLDEFEAAAEWTDAERKKATLKSATKWAKGMLAS